MEKLKVSCMRSHFTLISTFPCAQTFLQIQSNNATCKSWAYSKTSSGPFAWSWGSQPLPEVFLQPVGHNLQSCKVHLCPPKQVNEWTWPHRPSIFFPSLMEGPALSSSSGVFCLLGSCQGSLTVLEREQPLYFQVPVLSPATQFLACSTQGILGTSHHLYQVTLGY